MLQGKGEEHTNTTGQEADHEGAEEEDAPDQIVVEESGQPSAGEEVIDLREGGREEGKEGRRDRQHTDYQLISGKRIDQAAKR